MNDRRIIPVAALCILSLFWGCSRNQPSSSKPSKTVPVAAAQFNWVEANEARLGQCRNPDSAMQVRISDRLRKGQPTSIDLSAEEMLAWAAALNRASRDEYATRCISEADKIRSRIRNDDQDRWIEDPAILYEQAYNVASNEDIRVTAALRFQSWNALEDHNPRQDKKRSPDDWWEQSGRPRPN